MIEAAFYLAIFAVSVLLGRRLSTTDFSEIVRFSVIILVFTIGYWSGSKASPGMLQNSLSILFVHALVLVATTIMVGLLFDVKEYYTGAEPLKLGKVSFDIVLSVVAGWALGAASKPLGDEALGVIVQLELIALLVLVGLDVSKTITLETLREEFWITSRALAVSIISGFVAGMLSSAITGKSISYSLSLTLGMGWYSFTGPFVARYVGVEAGLTAFIFNMLREQLAFILTPVLRRPMVGLVSLGGATTMDNTLPVYVSTYGKEVTLAAIAHGALLTLFVPLLLYVAVSI